MMASEEPDAFRGKRKRERPKAQRKLLVDERVEVRSEEEEFHGSWHSGIVVACDKKRCRCVRYDHLLADDGSGKLVEAVRVSPALDGVVFGNGKLQSRRRVNIRPLPPPVGFPNWGLHYGLCVDVYYNDAWWEGVIFDHEDGEAKRTVFFPDLGDEMEVAINDLRITQDWDEVTGYWRRRGDWILLELIEEFEETCGDQLPVSVKQIWYDVREKRDFNKVREWTCRAKDLLWKKIVSEVINEYSEFLAKELCRRLEHRESLFAETRKGLVDTCGVLTVDDSVSGDTVMDHGTIPRGLLTSAPPGLDVDLAPEAETSGSKAASPLDQPLSSERVIDYGTVMKNVHGCSGKINNESLQRCDMATDPSVASLEPGVDQSTSVVNSDASLANPWTDLNIPYPKDALCGLPQVLPLSQSNDDGISSASPPGHGCKGTISKSSDNVIGTPKHQAREITVKWRPVSPEMLPGTEFCPDAVHEYYAQFCGRSPWRTKSRSSMQRDVWKHLLYLGWKIDHSNEKGVPRKRYTSPDGRCFYSLHVVCKHLKESMGDMVSSASPGDPRRLNASSNVSLCLEQPQESQNPDLCPQTVTSTEDTKYAYCSQPVMDYYQFVSEKCCRKKGLSDLRSEAKKQLSNAGWVISSQYYKNTGRKILVFKPPRGRVRYSLRAACKSFLDTEIYKSTASACRRTKRIKFIVGKKGISASNMQSFKISVHSFQENLVQPDTLSKVLSAESFMEPGKVKVRGIRKARRKRDGNFLDISAHIFPTWLNAQARRHGLQDGSKEDGKLSHEKDRNSTLSKVNTRKHSRAFINLRDGQDAAQPTYVLRSIKRVQEVVIPNSVHRNPRTTLSWLIDNNVVLPRAKVRYLNRKNQCMLAEGRITRKGIKCSCCGMLFSPSGFEVHAGSRSRKATSNIFLEDGRSLVDCQKLIMGSSKMQSFIAESRDRVKSNWQRGENDYICSVCHYGGELMLCDQCPSSFHKSCLGLKDIPEGNWFCPSCCCGICGKSKLNGEKEHTKDGGILTCSQCEHKYHVGCLRNKTSAKMKGSPMGNWFCNNICKKIFFRLQKLLGEQTTVGANNLTWSLLKPMKANNSCGIFSADVNAIENYSKLNVALGVMHECFKPVKESRTRRDLMEDVIFSRGSELQRLNFQGFYTVVLARNDELISVATVRVHGKKVAEVPLVGTRVQYRRLGMCRILMNELEKKLVELGVERLVLPAVPSVLNTWTSSFGFSQMTASERLHFLDCTFLDFQDTVMCQKLLTKIPSAELSPLKEVQPVFCGGVCEAGENIDIDRSSAISEVFQAEQTEDGQIAYQGQPERISAGHNSDTSNIPPDMVATVKQTQNPEFRPCVGVTETNQEFFTNITDSKRPYAVDSFLKCYKRRKKLTGASLVKVT